MTRWEYAQISDPESGTDSVQFSHNQDPGMVEWFSTALGRGLKAGDSNAAFLHLNLSHTNVVRVCGLMGERGWEVVGFATLTGGHAYWMLKKELPAP